MLTRRELNLRIFDGTADAVLWQPRLETWYYKLKEDGKLPKRYADLEYYEFYDKLGCSVRYAASRGLTSEVDPDEVEHRTEILGDEVHEVTVTDIGELRTVYREIWQEGRLRNRRIAKFAVTTPDDLRVLTPYRRAHPFPGAAQTIPARRRRGGPPGRAHAVPLKLRVHRAH